MRNQMRTIVTLTLLQEELIVLYVFVMDLIMAELHAIQVPIPRTLILPRPVPLDLLVFAPFRGGSSFSSEIFKNLD